MAVPNHQIALSPIVQFVEEYDPTPYSLLADFAKQKCQQILQGAGILSNITARAKSRDRLRAKVQQRNLDKQRNGPGKPATGPYQSVQEIKNDLVDLTGVRIALYFPRDAARVVQLLQDPIESLGWTAKPFTNPVVKPLNQGGYQATHLRLTVNPDALSAETSNTILNITFEIQVASLLMHCWSEVSHDLGYKTLTGQLTQPEKDCLSNFNDQVRGCEDTLSELQDLIVARAAAQPPTTILHSTYELGACLRNFLAEYPKQSNFAMGSLDWLRYVTRHLELSTPTSLGKILAGWSHIATQMTSPLVPSILNYLILHSVEANVEAAGSFSKPLLSTAYNTLLSQHPFHTTTDVARLILRDVVLNSYDIDSATMNTIKSTASYQVLKEAGLFGVEVTAGAETIQLQNMESLWNEIIKFNPKGIISLGIARAKIGVQLGYCS
ncbi:hypothetical protein HG530_008454 [Fusarium avenaceum]|nr:hypothetical protein HG530_008454 [Fusarium avenaceum]